MNHDEATAKARAYYTETWSEHRADLQTLMWSGPASQFDRFHRLLEVADLSAASVLDVGCGFADLCTALHERFPKAKYTGLELIEGIATTAQEKQPNAEIICGTLDTLESGRQWDWVMESGVFNMDWCTIEVVEQMLSQMFERCKSGVAANFLSALATGKCGERAAYYEPGAIVTIASRLSRRFVLRHDYRDNDFAVYILKDADHPGRIAKAPSPPAHLVHGA